MPRRVSRPSFVGRAAELAAARAALGRAGTGMPGVLLVAGESGVGESRFLSELAGSARDGALVLQGDCIELGEGELPYAPVVGALRNLVRVVEPGTLDLSDEIDQAGRIEEAAELAIEGIAVCGRAGCGRLFGTFLASEAALRLIRLGRYEQAERVLAEAFALSPVGQAAAALHQGRAQLLIERGDPAAAQLELERGGEQIEVTISQWIGPLAAAEVEAALWRGDPDGAASIAERALSRLGDAVFPSQVVPLHAHSLRAEADRRSLARARSEPPGAARPCGRARARPRGPVRSRRGPGGPRVGRARARGGRPRRGGAVRGRLRQRCRTVRRAEDAVPNRVCATARGRGRARGRRARARRRGPAR